MANVKVIGAEDIIKNLRKYQLIKRTATEAVLKEIGLKIEASAKKGTVPVDTGRLRASLSTNWSGSSSQYGKVGSDANPEDGVGRPTGPKGLAVVVGSNLPYSQVQEFGSWGDARKSGKQDVPKSRKSKPDKEKSKRPKEGFLYLTKAYTKHRGDLVARIKKIYKKDERL